MMFEELKFWETPEARRAQKKRVEAKKAAVKRMRKRVIVKKMRAKKAPVK